MYSQRPDKRSSDDKFGDGRKRRKKKAPARRGRHGGHLVLGKNGNLRLYDVALDKDFPFFLCIEIFARQEILDCMMSGNRPVLNSGKLGIELMAGIIRSFAHQIQNRLASLLTYCPVVLVTPFILPN